MPKPTEINLHRQSAVLEIKFADGVKGALSAEYLRVYSPSAEVRGHSPEQATLQTDKEDVAIVDIQAVGNYAVRLTFSDGHDTGLYTWDYLYELTTQQKQKWQDYLNRLQSAGKSRKPDKPVTVQYYKPNNKV